MQTAARDPLAPVVQFGPMSLVNGKVLFSDFFIKPNYSADLTELTGKLGAFSSEAPGSEPQLAALELLGRAEGSASLEVSGQLNPWPSRWRWTLRARCATWTCPSLALLGEVRRPRH